MGVSFCVRSIGSIFSEIRNVYNSVNEFLQENLDQDGPSEDNIELTTAIIKQTKEKIQSEKTKRIELWHVLRPNRYLPDLKSLDHTFVTTELEKLIIETDAVDSRSSPFHDSNVEKSEKQKIVIVFYPFDSLLMH